MGGIKYKYERECRRVVERVEVLKEQDKESRIVSDYIFFFKQKTAYEILTCDWSSDVCSSDLFISENRFTLPASVLSQ